MSFITVRSNARNRFNEAQVYLNHIISLEPKNPLLPASLELKIMRGLFQVHLYAALEKTINEIVEQALRDISSRRVKNSHFIIEFNAISLYNKLKSLKDSGHDKFFPKATEIFLGLSDKSTAAISETIFSSALQNVWAKTIEEVINSFGIKGYTIGVSERAVINELVEKRNSVAHGRESASVIGERQRADVLLSKMSIISNFAHATIDLLDNYCINKKFIKASAKRYY